MPLTNAQKQKDTRARRKAKLERLARLEGALREIAAEAERPSTSLDWANGFLTAREWSSAIARQALGDVG